MRSSWLLKDGVFFLADEHLFTASDLTNILFREEIRSVRNQFPFWFEHLQLISLKFRLLNQPEPGIIQNKGADLRRQLERFLVKNKLFKSAIIHVYFFKRREEAGYLITHERIEQISFELNANGIFLRAFEKLQKPISSLSAISFGSETIWNVMREHLSPLADYEFFVTNTYGCITECPGKNIFLVKGDLVVTPSVSSGTYVDLSQELAFKAIRKAGCEIRENDQLTEEELNDSEEVFLASAIKGIEWVKGFGNKRYFCNKVKKISEAFNDLLIQ